MEEWVLGIAGAVLSLWLGSIEVRMRNQDSRLRDAPSRKEMKEDIKIHLESVRVLQQELKEDIKEMRKSLEKLLESK